MRPSTWVHALVTLVLAGGLAVAVLSASAQHERNAHLAGLVDSLKIAKSLVVDVESHTDTVTRTVTTLLAEQQVDTLWRHDTLRVAGDTTLRYAVPVTTVVRWDSTAKACSDLVSSCALERDAWHAETGLLEREVAAMQASQRGPAFGIGGAVGVGVNGKPSLTLGVTYGWRFP